MSDRNGNQVFTSFLPFGKVEENPDGTLTIWGRATQEIGDSAGETMDYASSVPFFQRRSQENSDRSGGHNMMALRSMHQSIAAGKVDQFEYNDAEKAIDIAALVVDPVEIAKVRSHVYTGLSVGGKYVRRWADGGTTRYTADPREISLVDAPAVPTAKLTLFKMDLPEDDAWVGEYRDAAHEAKSQLQKSQQLTLLSELIGRLGEIQSEGPTANSTDLSKNGQSNDLGPIATLQQLLQEVKTMSDLQKLDVGSVVSALKSAASQSAALGATDPQAALSTLLGAIAAIDTGSAISGQSVPVNDPSVVMKAAPPTFIQDKMKEKEEKPVSKQPAAVEAAEPAAEEIDETQAEEDAEPVEAYKSEMLAINTKVDALADGVNSLLDTLTKRVATAPAAAGDSPVQGLNSLITGKEDAVMKSLTDVEAAIIKCFDEGGPYAMLKALNIAGANDELTGGSMAYQTVNNAVRKASYASLEAGGVVTASRYSGRLFG